MSKLVKGISTGIGMVKENNAARQARKSPEPQPSAGTANTEPYNEDTEDPSSDHDEADWILDDAQQYNTDEAPDAPRRGASGKRSVDDLVAHFLRQHPAPNPAPASRLAAPVVLPQRRPQTKRRGFVRAYAPSLAPQQISQDTFLDFLAVFDDAIESSPWFHAVNLAVVASHAVPSVAVHFAAMAAHISIEAARRVQATRQGNDFLFQANEGFFKPRGLFALLMTYKPGSAAADSLVDVTASAGQAAAAQDAHGSPGFRQSLKSSAGKSRGELELPDAAPLVFPGIEAMTAEQKQSSFKRAMGVSADYMDRRAQATYNAENPDSKLTVTPEPVFASRFGDPNHPVNSGSLVALLSGGHVNPKARRGGLLGGSGRGGGGRLLSGRGASDGRAGEGKVKERGGLLKSVKRYMHEDVYYLMIVNMPTDEEIAVAMAEEKQAA